MPVEVPVEEAVEAMEEGAIAGAVAEKAGVDVVEEVAVEGERPLSRKSHCLMAGRSIITQATSLARRSSIR